MTILHCPTLLIAAPNSGAGKTTFTAGLARFHRNQGRRVRVFKMGPDFLDPLILEKASGAPVHSLDLWMVGDERCAELLYAAAQESDLILIEGAMGLFDGNPSAADLAERFGIPVLALLDAKGQAQTFGALALGLARYRPNLIFAGVVANQIGSAYHSLLLAESLPKDIHYWGGMPRDTGLNLPERHLGLAMATEITDLDIRIERAAAHIAETRLSELPDPVAFSPVNRDHKVQAVPCLAGSRIGIAKDAAFAFIYQANIDLLQALGAKLFFFSPLHDTRLPEVDSLYFPGGYPELHLQALAANVSLRLAIQAHNAANKPIYAECGGMLYLLDELESKESVRIPMLGLLPGRAKMQEKLCALGLQSLDTSEICAGTKLRGHTFHYSKADISLSAWKHAQRQRGESSGEAVYKLGAITATYLHLYFPSQPEAAAAFFLPPVMSPVISKQNPYRGVS